MDVTKSDYKFQKFNQENVENLVADLGFNVDNYFLTMTKPSLLSRALIGNIVDFSSRYCIVCFSETEINLIMLSRMDNKKVTEIVKIDRNEINDMKLSNVLISYMLQIKAGGSTMKLQVFKKVGGFAKTTAAIELFKKLYQ